MSSGSKKTSGEQFDHRGENMGKIAAAHRLAQEADTRREMVTQCMKCGKSPNKPGCSSEIKLMKCGRCNSAVYCSRDCQSSDWPNHKARCKQLKKQREIQKKLEEELRNSKTDSEVQSLGQRFSGDASGEAQEVLRLLGETKDEYLQMKLIARLSEEMYLLRACHDDDELADRLYQLMGKLADRDCSKLKELCQPSNRGKASQLNLPSWHAVLGILRSRPGEVGYVAPQSSEAAISSYSADRCERYFRKCWMEHIVLCAATWEATDSGGHPSLYVTCKDLWRQLPLCVVHGNAARAVFDSYRKSEGPPMETSPHFHPLIRMLDLKDKADDLEGLTNQVAAILVVHARKMDDKTIINAKALERAITARFDGAQKMQWRMLSLSVAEAMVKKGGQLEGHEFSRVLQKAGLGR